MNNKNNKQYKEIMENPNETFLKLDLKYDTNSFQKELNNAIDKHFKNPEKTTTKVKGWSNFGLHAINKDEARPYTNYGYKNEDEVPYDWTDFEMIVQK